MRTWLFHAPRALLMLLVRGYQLFLSAWLGSSCRFTLSCSAYSLQALERHGALAGSLLTVGRLARCHPWCRGGHDPVPAPGAGLFTRLVEPAVPARAGWRSLPFRFNLRKKTRP
jgi:putative membrane protein insertion efficiency factor